ncbi:unnamed protein product [Miscanthus lutarioriparius]|uniref:Uncharacterized protein n=1 Tax=Miscanthus lutarioriparius TaxID=422564 RepID=A0A811N8J0_9POAL|nr:unnamed protein product [Miscanthus lutarioriparius]
MARNRYHADFVSMHGSPGVAPKAISLDFQPSAHVRIEAVSAHRSLACCAEADMARPPCYYVCKPASRQWRALPSPQVRFRTAAVAMVARPSASSTAAEFKVVRAEAWQLIALPREVDETDDPWARKRIAAVEGRLCLLVLTDAAVDEAQPPAMA